MVDKVHVSKTMCSFLRHNPEEVGGLDSEGFTSLESLVKALDEARDEYKITEEVVREIVEEDDKDRYEIVDDKIRATHGHSDRLDVNIKRETEDSSVPEFLYHGTPRENVDSIMDDTQIK